MRRVNKNRTWCVKITSCGSEQSQANIRRMREIRARMQELKEEAAWLLQQIGLEAEWKVRQGRLEL